MEARRSSAAAAPLLVVVVVVATLQTTLGDAVPTKFTVGDSQAWNPNVNYTVWEKKHAPFHVGDWLVFYYTTGMADVLLVDEAAYNKCDSSHPISNYSKGRSYAFQLNETKRYYFICSFGYCYQGMKVTVRALPLPPPSPPPKPSAAAPPLDLGSRTLAAAGFAIAAALLRLM